MTSHYPPEQLVEIMSVGIERLPSLFARLTLCQIFDRLSQFLESQSEEL